MVDESRIGLYNYVYNLLYGVVTENVYSMNEPQELTESDTKDGFIVIRIGDIRDESEFHLETYGWVRVFVEAYIPPISRGRLDKAKYKAMEDAINAVINSEIESGTNTTYSIEPDGIISSDMGEDSNGNNAYYMFIKSFIVSIDMQKDVPIHYRELFIGIGTDELSTIEDVESLTNLQHYTNSDIVGDYSITFDATKYLWICTASEIKGVTSGGFVVPMNEPVQIEDLLCYRSASDIVAGDMQFTIK